MMARMRGRTYRITSKSGDQDPLPSPNPPDPSLTDEAAARLKFEADQARADAARLRKEMDEIRKLLPTPEDRARWAELEAQHAQDEEKRMASKGQFDEWRAQINDKHAKEIQAAATARENEAARAAKAERELEEEKIVQAFYSATEWFGPTGKTVMLPDVAKAYFGPNVVVETVPAPNGGPSLRRVVVRDSNGTILVDPRTGNPLPFEKAIGELIDAHPSKAQLLRNSGRVGSGSAGGTGTETKINMGRLRPEDFRNPATRQAVKDQLAVAGGLQIGPGFDAVKDAVTRK